MEFELHIWGPAFGLPSIDAECIAAVAYFNSLLDHQRWSLFIAHDPSQSPTGDFPALYHSSNWIGGFSAIVNYLARQGYSLDSRLSSHRQAESKVIITHLTANALPLLDATFYASSANYATVTRPAWSRIVPAYANFVVPPRKLAAAKSRASSLGLSSGSVDDLPTDDISPQFQQEARMISSSPSLIFRRNKTLQEALRVQQSRNLFRLEALTQELVEPLADFLGDKLYLLSDQQGSPNSVDCLALGYLSLLLNTDFENNWVGDTIKKKFARMAAYVDRLQRELLPDSSLDAEQLAMNGSWAGASTPENKSLPWLVAPPSSPTTIFRYLSRSLLSTVISPMQQQMVFGSTVLRNSSPTALRSWTSPLTLVSTLSAPLTALVGYFMYVQTHSNLERHKRFNRATSSNFQGLGESAQVLSALSLR